MKCMDQDAHRYDDMLRLPHPVSDKHPHMSGLDRAAQFAPFAALTGFGAAITESARLTSEKAELDEYEKAVLNDKLCVLVQNLEEAPTAIITYFQPDQEKTGGIYVTAAGVVKKIDPYTHTVVLMDGKTIPVEDIVDINMD